jgi:hypothetical protein
MLTLSWCHFSQQNIVLVELPVALGWNHLL